MIHEQYTITVSFEVCEGTKIRALDEVKDLLAIIKAPNTLGHASNVKVKVEHQEVK